MKLVVIIDDSSFSVIVYTIVIPVEVSALSLILVLASVRYWCADGVDDYMELMTAPWGWC